MIGRTNADGGGGITSDDVNVTKGDILKGCSTVTNDSDDEVVAGTLELTGNANDPDVPAGKTYYNTNAKQKRTGTKPVNGPMNATLNCGQSKTIPAGDTTGGIVTANTLASQTSATAGAAGIISGQTAWVNGSKITGNMAERGGYGGTGNSQGNDAGNARFYLNLPNGHYNENARAYISWSNVRSWVGLTADKIKKGVPIMGTLGTYEGYVTAPLYLYNNGAWSNLQTTGVSATWRGGGNFLERVPSKDLYINSPAYAQTYTIGRINQSINLTNYNYLNVNFRELCSYPNEYYHVRIGISTNPNLQSLTFASYFITTSAGISILNISSFTGNYYIYFTAQGMINSNRPIYGYITQVFLTTV